MDFHNMKRRELQKLCKEHDISANLSSLDMVDKLSSLFKVKGKEEERPLRKTRSCLKNCDEMLSETESDALKRKSKKVRFNPQNDVFQLEGKSERSLVVENSGGVGRITRDRAKLAKTILISPVVMKKKGKRAVQEVEKEDLVVEDEGGASRVTRGRATLGKCVVIASPVVMKKKGKRAVQEVEKEDLVVVGKGGASRVTRGRAMLGKSVVIASPVVMKKRGKRALQADEKGDLAVENKAGVSRVTRAKALLGEKVLTSPVVMKRSKKAVQEDEKADMVVENKGGASRVTRARAGKQVLISSPVVMKKRGKKAIHEEKKSDSSHLVVEFTRPPLKKENEVVTVKFLRNRKVENVLSPKKIVRNRNTQNRSQGVNAEVLENKEAEADGGITQPKMGTRRSARNVNISEELMDETDQKVSRKNLRQSTRQRASAKSSVEDVEKKTVAKETSEPEVVTRQSKRNRMEFTQVEPSEENLGVTEKSGRKKITRSRNQFKAKASTVGGESETRDVSEEAKEAVIQVKEPARRSGRHVNKVHTNFANDSEMPIESDESTRYQTRHGTRRVSVMPQMKKAKMEKPVAGKLGKKNIVVKGSSNESTKPIVPETGDIRRSKRNTSGDGSLVISEDASGSGTDIKTGSTKKRKRDAVVEEVPLQHTGRRVNTKADNISAKLEKDTPVASETRTRSGNRQNSLMPSAKKLNMSGNLGPSRITGEKASPHHTRELSSVSNRPATGVRQSKTVSVTPRTRSGSGQKSFIHTTKKLRMSGNSGLHKTIRDKESPHQSRELSMVPKHSETESKARGSKSKQTPVIHEHSRRFTRSALKGKTDGPTYVRGKFYQKKSQSVSKLPLSEVESSLSKVISASEGPLDIDVQSSDHEVDRSTVNLVSSASDLLEDKTASSTPQGGSAKASSVDLNMQESEDPELINIHAALPSNPRKLQSDHAELEMDISAGGHASVERPASYDVQSSIPQIAGCSTDPMFDASNSCRDIDSCEILQDRATEAYDKTLVNVKPAEASDVAGDVAFIDRNRVDDGFSSIERITLKGMEVNPQTFKNVEPNSGGITNVVLEGTTSREESMNQLPFPEDGCSTISVSKTGDVNERSTTAKQQENSCETNVASPYLVHFKADAASGDAFPVDTNALTDISLVDQSTSRRTSERSQPSKDVESISKGIDLNLVFQGPAIHDDEPVCQSPLAEDAEITDNPVTGNNDAACVTQQEGPTVIYAKSPSLVHLKSVDNVYRIGDAGSIADGSVDDLSNVEQINSPAINEKQGFKNENHVVADRSPVNEELTAEIGDCCLTEQEYDVRNHSAEFAESGEFGKDFRGASTEVCEGSFADLTNQTVSMIFTEEKDDTMHPEISVQADEPHNTSSKSRMKVAADSVARENNKSELKAPSSPLHVTKLGNLVVEVNEEPEPEDSPSNLSSDISGRSAADGSSLQKERSSVISADVSENNQLKNAKDESEIRETVSVSDSPIRGMRDMPDFISSLPSHVVAEVKELKPEDSGSLWSTEIIPERAAEDGSPLHKEHSSDILADDSRHNQSEDARYESEIRQRVSTFDMPDFFSVSQTSDFNFGRETCTENEPSEVDIELINKGEQSTEIIPERAAEDGSSLHKEHSSDILTDDSEHNQSEDARDESEIRQRVSTFGMPEFFSVSQTSDFNFGGETCRENEPSEVDTELINEGEKHSAVGVEGREGEETIFEDTVEIDSERTSSMHEDAHHISDGQLPMEREWDLEELKCEKYSVVDVEGREGEATVFGDTVENDSERTSGMHDEAHHISDSQLPMEREWDLEELKCSISGDVEERRMNNSISRERTPFISEDDVDRDGISGPVIVTESPSIVDDHCHTPSEDSCGKEQGTDMSMVKSCRNFGKEFSSQHDFCHRPLKDSCAKEQGTPMSLVKSSNDCGQEFSTRHDNIIEHVKVCSSAAQTICRDFAGLDNQMVADSMGSTGRRISKAGALNNVTFEETEPCKVLNDKIVLGDGNTSLKGNVSNLARNLVKDSGGYCVSEEDHDGKDTIDSNRFEDALEFDMNYFETDSNLKGICQENDEPPFLVPMDIDTTNAESSRDKLIAVSTIHGFDQESDASGEPTKELPRNEHALDSDALANMQYGGENATLTVETNEVEVLLTEELPRNEDAMYSNAPASLQYGGESLNPTEQTNEAQESGPGDLHFFSDLFGPELKSRSVEIDGEESGLWYENTSLTLDKSEIAGKEVDIFTVGLTEEQLCNSGEEHAREKGTESIENQLAAFNNPGTEDVNISVDNSLGALNESHLKSEANKDAHQKVDCCDNNKFDEDFTGARS